MRVVGLHGLMGGLPSIAICSLMRAGAAYEPAYFWQILSLVQKSFTLASVNIVYDAIGEDSYSLHQLLRGRGVALNVMAEKPREAGSQIFSERLSTWADVGNECVEMALRESPGASHLVWIESDLCYPYDTLEILIQSNVDIVAPLVYLGNSFYDSWGFRDRANRKIYSFPAGNPGIESKVVELNSVGSFVLFRSEIFQRGVRFRGAEYEDGLLVGVCNDARSLGFKIFANRSLSILHPVSAWREQIWRLTNLVIYLNKVKVVCLPKANCVVAGPYPEMFSHLLDPICQSLAGYSISQIEVKRDQSERSFEAHLFFDSMEHVRTLL